MFLDCMRHFREFVVRQENDLDMVQEVRTELRPKDFKAS